MEYFSLEKAKTYSSIYSLLAWEKILKIKSMFFISNSILLPDFFFFQNVTFSFKFFIKSILKMCKQTVHKICIHEIYTAFYDT